MLEKFAYTQPQRVNVASMGEAAVHRNDMHVRQYYSLGRHVCSLQQ